VKYSKIENYAHFPGSSSDPKDRGVYIYQQIPVQYFALFIISPHYNTMTGLDLCHTPDKVEPANSFLRAAFYGYYSAALFWEPGFPFPLQYFLEISLFPFHFVPVLKREPPSVKKGLILG
jgi:hypothetical protein